MPYNCLRVKQTETWREFAQASLWNNCPKLMHFLFNISLPKLNVHSMQSLPGGKETSKKWNDQIQEAEQDFSQRDKLMVKLKFHNRNIIQATMMISVT